MRVRAALAIVLGFAAAPAAAATCTVNPQSVNFGGYDTLSVSALDSVGAIRVVCDGLAAFTVGLGNGGSSAQRRLTAGANSLNYNLYSDSTRLLLWADGAGSAQAGQTGLAGGTVNLNVYGRIPARQNVPAGAYADSVTVTVTF